MSTVRSRDEILDLVKQWSRDEQIEFAEEILAGVPGGSVHRATKPLRDLLGIAVTDGTQFTDEELDRMLEEERLRRLGA